MLSLSCVVLQGLWELSGNAQMEDVNVPESKHGYFTDVQRRGQVHNYATADTSIKCTYI